MSSITKINNVFKTEFDVTKDILPAEAKVFEAKFPYYLGPSLNNARSTASLAKTRKQISLYGLYKSKADLDTKDLKNLLALFGEDIFSKTIDMNKIFFSASQRIGTSADLKQDKWEGKAKFTTPSKEQVLKQIIKPLLKKWVQKNVNQKFAKSAVGEDLKLLYDKWLNEESNNAGIIEQINYISSGQWFGSDISDFLFKNIDSETVFTYKDADMAGVPDAIFFKVPLKLFLEDLINATNTLEGSGPIGTTNSLGIPTLDAASAYKVGTGALDVASILGFDSLIDSQLGADRGAFDTFAGRTAAEIEQALKSNPEIFAKIAAGVQGTSYKEPTLEELISIRQCALVTRLLHDDAKKIQFSNYFNDGNFANSPLNANQQKEVGGTTHKVYARNEDGKPVLTANTRKQVPSGYTGHERIYCVDPKYDPNLFYNKCHITKAAKETLIINTADDTKLQGSMFKKLYWVFETDDGLREIELPLTSNQGDKANAEEYYLYTRARAFAMGTDTLTKRARVKGLLGEEISLDQIDTKISSLLDNKPKAGGQSYYFLNDIEIKFEGTNPSTARNDVQVQMSFTLSSMTALERVMATIPKDVTGTANDVDIKLYELITLPATGKVSKGPAAWAQNQYNPEYSRVRLKAYTSDSHKSDLIIDLSMIDHSISRDSETGKTTLTINYRGFFEAMMNMPFNDALADNATITKREELHGKAMSVIKGSDCTPQLINKAMRLEQEVFRQETKQLSAMSLLTRLSNKKLVHGYTIKEDQVKARAVNGTLDAFQDYVTSVAPGAGTLSEVQEEKVQTETQKVKDDKDTDAKDLLLLKNKFFFLGDLLWMVSGCLYKNETANMRDIVKNLNMRFIIGTINVPNPKTKDGSMISINPVCIPVDVAYFVEWFNSVIVNKGITTYPVGIFIKELIERLINNIIYEVCFSSLLPSENPPIIRTSFMSNFEVGTETQSWFKKDNNGWFNPDQPYNSSIVEGDNLFKKDAQFNLNSIVSDVVRKTEPYNYCVIYQQFPTFSQYTTKDSKQKLRNSDYVPTIFYGARNTDYNYVSSVSFSKTDSPFLREARYANSNYGTLSLLANVYDLNFSFIRRKANTFLYPGIIINFGLIDWASKGSNSPYTKISDNAGAKNEAPDSDDYTVLGNSNPHSPKSLAHILGFGGYYIIKSVVYKLGQTDEQFEINITTKFMGSDAIKTGTRGGEEGEKKLEDKKECVDAFDKLAERVNSFEDAEFAEKASVKKAEEGEEIKTPTLNEKKTPEVEPDEETEELVDPATNEEKFQQIISQHLGLTPADDNLLEKDLKIIEINNFDSSKVNKVLDELKKMEYSAAISGRYYRTKSGKYINLFVSRTGRLYNNGATVARRP